MQVSTSKGQCMNKVLIGVAVSAALAGCGGESESPQACPAALPPLSMSVYAGTWSSACTQHRVQRTVITSTQQNTANMSSRTDFYANADCSGAVLGSIADSAVVTATPSGLTQALVVLAPGSAPVALGLEQVTLSSTASTKTFTGPWELKQSGDGVRELCLKVAGGAVACAQDPGTVPASSGVTAYLHQFGGGLYRVALSGTTYSVVETFARPYTPPPAYAGC